MAIPPFTLDGVLPPFVGVTPGAAASMMSPYAVTAIDVVGHLGTTPGRQEILRGWLEHRAAMRAIGIVKGFQWLNGSFVEDKDPNDLDLVIFTQRPASDHGSWPGWRRLAELHPNVFHRDTVKADSKLDVFFVQLDGNPEVLVSRSRYWLQLFSHQRVSARWKGMLQVTLASPDDAARAQLDTLASNGGPE
jgi:hypothetical protein